MNSFLSMKCAPSIPLLHNEAILILGMDVSHGSPGRSDVPSISAVCEFKEMAFNILLWSRSSHSITMS
ncbi:hypothetical protein HN51_007272 [Arachis hypogaea]